ncbi:MAG: Activator of Hsp90 ATPase 1 family protein [Chloroflexi bacterium]|nr:Activator of Hsp90 ATPase 1 family protein [Chloroflexota bacterium]
MTNNHVGRAEPIQPESTTVELRRTFAGSCDTVFEAWTEPPLLAQWWWPARFQTTHEVDLHVGGRYRFASADLPGMGVLCVTGRYLELRTPEKLVYSWVWEGADSPETIVTAEFHCMGSRTEVVLRHAHFADEGERDNHVQGWNDCLDRLAELVSSGETAGM